MAKLFLLLLALGGAIALPAPVDLQPKDQHPDVGLDVIEMIQKYGYPVEQHKYVETEDGYLLEVHRIPHGLNNAEETNKPVIFLMHGLLCSSADWVVMGPGKGLAYLLADLGYDVWMGNARGSTWSRKHIEYNPNKDSAFWKFSWNEIGMYDLPAMIDYVLAQTNQDKLFYAGHSQGTTSYFVMMSTRPEYNEKIRLMMALAPVAFMSNMTNPLFHLLALFEDALDWLTSFVGIDEFLPSNDLFGLLGQTLCNDEAIFQDVCGSIIFIIAGFDSDQLNKTMIPVITSNTPAGASTKQLIHYAQGINTGKFRKYDYGLVENLVKYGSIHPPEYELDNVSSNVALFYSANDWLAAVTDVDELHSKLPNVVYKYFVPHPKFNHLDYLYAIDAENLVYSRMFSLMKAY